MLETIASIFAPGDIAACADRRWSPGIGDPTPMGWATVGLYFVAAALALVVLLRWRRFPPDTRRAETALWATLVAGLLFLGVNKELDLQSLLTAVGRCVSQTGGWYERRRVVQAAFIAGVLLAALVGGAIVTRRLKGALGREWLALLGAGALVAFVAVRAAGFHHFDALIGMKVAGWRMNWVMEMGAIALTMLGALKVLADLRRRDVRRAAGT